jgi:uncharacterized protein YxjI
MYGNVPPPQPMVNPMMPPQPQFVPSPYPNQQVMYMPVQQVPQQIIQPVTIVQQRQGYPMGTVFNMPTRWQIKERWFSCGDMKIKDAFNNDVFQLESLSRFWPASMRIIDLRTGLEACYIEQKVRFGMPHFKIMMGGRHVATIKSRFQFFSQKYDVEFHNGQQDLIMKGNWGAYDFTIQRGPSAVGHVSKKFFTCADNYGLEVQPGEDVVVMMACVAVIDRCCHDNSSSSNVSYDHCHHHC